MLSTNQYNNIHNGGVKDNMPVMYPVTKTWMKSPNMIRMYFSSNDKLITSNTSAPAFSMSSASFHAFDLSKPVYVLLESFVNGSSTTPSSTYALAWDQLVSHQYWHSGSLQRVIGVFKGDNSTRNQILDRGTLAFRIDNPNMVFSTSQWSFRIIDNTGALISTTNTGTFIFSLVFFQMDD